MTRLTEMWPNGSIAHQFTEQSCFTMQESITGVRYVEFSVTDSQVNKGVAIVPYKGVLVIEAEGFPN